MDFEDAVDWAEPSNMRTQEYVDLIDQRLEEFARLPRSDVVDQWFTYLALREVLSGLQSIKTELTPPVSAQSVETEQWITDATNRLVDLWRVGLNEAVYQKLVLMPPGVAAAVAAGVSHLLGSQQALAFFFGIRRGASLGR
jgi:hypothetical protein